MIARLDAFQQRHPWLGFPIAVIYKYVDDQAGYLAALITYYGFLSLFPLLLLGVTILGFLLDGNPDLQDKILNSALRELPVLGDDLRNNVHTLHGSVSALVTGILIALYGVLGGSTAAQAALDRVWGVPRFRRPDPLTARLRGVLLLVVLGVGLIATTVVSELPSTGILAIGTVIVAIAVNTGIILAAYGLLTTRSVGVKDIWVGAVTAAIAWQILQAVGGYYVRSQLRGASQVYGVFGIVFGLMAWIYLGAVIFLICAEINSVLADRLWPRALMTPFTDDVDLTAGDRRSYRMYAQTEQHKGFQDIDVTFRDRPTEGPGTDRGS
jgi:YihY family inner membrane protein